MKSPKSLPAENAPGTPAITTQRIGEFPLALSIASAIASYIGEVSAFFFSGRFMRMMRIGPWSIMMTLIAILVPSGRRAGKRDGRDRIGAFRDSGFQPARQHCDIFRKKTRERDAARRLRIIEPDGRERVLGQRASTSGGREQPQIRCRARQPPAGGRVARAKQPV